MTRSFWAAPGVATIAGLVLLLAAAGAWVAGEDVREIGEVLVTEPVAMSGTQFAPTAVVFGLAGLLGGVVLGLTRGAARRVVAGLTVATAAGAIAVLALGLGRALQADGAVTPAPYFALAAAFALLVAGIAGVRGPQRPPDRSRYRVAEEHAVDDEWGLASAEDEPQA